MSVVMHAAHYMCVYMFTLYRWALLDHHNYIVDVVVRDVRLFQMCCYVLVSSIHV